MELRSCEYVACCGTLADTHVVSVVSGGIKLFRKLATRIEFFITACIRVLGGAIAEHGTDLWRNHVADKSDELVAERRIVQIHGPCGRI